MIINFSLVRLSIIFLLVILLPLIQNQWLNLYLFDTNNFSLYKILYSLSGLLCPLLVCVNSINKFTYYKFSKSNIINRIKIKGKSLLITALIPLITLSTIISNYIFINFDLFFKLFISNNYIFSIDIDKQLIFILIISILLIFRKTRLFMKKFILFNFFMISIFIWYSQLNNILINETFFINNFLYFRNTNFINILIFLSIETVYYLWSYISYRTNLSDWIVPIPTKNDISQILKILIFYLLIIFYYSILT